MISRFSQKTHKRWIWASCSTSVAAFALGAGVLAEASLAQTPSIPQLPSVPQNIVPPEADISRRRVEPLPLPDPGYDLRLLSPEKSAVPRAVDEIQFSVKRIRVTDSTVFTTKELSAIFSPLEDKRIALDDLRKAADKLENLYRSRGYFLTRVFVPPQEVIDETLEVRVVEGYIGNVFVDAPNDGSRKLAQGIVGPVVKHRPIRLVELESPLLVLNDMPGVRAAGVLKTGAAPSSSDLQLKVERKPTQSFAAISNFSSDAIGPMTYSIGTTLSQPFGAPGLLEMSLSAAGETLNELQAFNARYVTRLGNKGVTGSLGAVIARASPGGAIAPLDVQSRSGSVSARVRVPLLRSRANSFYLDTGFTLNRSRVSALSQPIVDDRSSVADLALGWRQLGWLGGDMTVRVGLSKGLLVLGANDRTTLLASVAGFKPNFVRLTYLLQRNQPLVGQLSAGILVQGQYSSSRLLSGEQMMFGGSFIGRGYDPSQLVGDRGIGLLGELRVGLPSLSIKGQLDNAQFYMFGDAAETTILPLSGQIKTTTSLSSLGIGIRALALRRIFVDAHVASARKTLSATAPRGERVNLTATVLF